MRVTLIIAILLLGFFTRSSDAAIRRVPQQYSTIQAAITATSSGDTVLVAPGNFLYSVLLNRRITLIGAGYDLTQVGQLTITTGSNLSVFEGIRFVPCCGESYPIHMLGTLGDVYFRRCMFESASTQNVYQAGGANERLYFDNCIFKNTYTAASDALILADDTVILRNCLFVNTVNNAACRAFGGRWAGLTAYNCTFLGMNQMGEGVGAQTMFVNCVNYDTSTASAFQWNLPPGSRIEFCPSESYGSDDWEMPLTSNPFVNYNRANNYQHGLSNLHPVSGSILINGGHPSMVDRDGSRVDLGHYGGLIPFVDSGIPAYPYIASVSVPTTLPFGTPVSISATVRIGRAY